MTVRKLLAAWGIALLIPYVTTLAWTGQAAGEVKDGQISSGRVIHLDREEESRYLDVEEYLIGVVAKQVPVDYGTEVMCAQTVIARTYIYKVMGERLEVEESELDMDYMGWNQMTDEWGRLQSAENYQAIEAAVHSTGTAVMTYEGEYIDPLFHAISAGRTRQGDSMYPYLAAVDSSKDVESEGYLNITLMSKDEFAQKIGQIPEGGQVTAENLFDTIQIIQRDEVGYILEIQIGTASYTGEEVQYALGISSPAFSIEPYEDQVRITSMGKGHGYGLSQYGAKVRADDGWTAEEILAYYYKDVTLISQYN